MFPLGRRNPCYYTHIMRFKKEKSGVFDKAGNECERSCAGHEMKFSRVRYSRESSSSDGWNEEDFF